MRTHRVVAAVRTLLVFGSLAGIVLLYRWLHVNPTTVALTLVLSVLLVAARVGLRYAVAASVAGAACYNFFFLPPFNTFTIADPQNWLALFAFLATAIVGSRLSQRARDEADQARLGQSELRVLFTLSRELLQAQDVAELVNALPSLTLAVARASSVTLFLLEGDRLYQAGAPASPGDDATPAHLRELALRLPAPELVDGQSCVPLRAGVRPRGLLRLAGVQLSPGTLEAIGGLVSIALDRAQALEAVAHGQAAQESERLRTLMLDSITHALRTPLTGIKGAASTLLSTDALPDDARRELLTIVDEEADRLNRLVAQAVEMAQIETQEVHMHFAPAELRDVVADTHAGCAWVWGAHPVTVHLPPELPPVLADREMLGKVVCNLLENAAKYSAPGSPIFLSAEREDATLLVSVADRGVGIDPAEQGLIFDRLYRSRAQGGQTPGTGMGLPISRAIVEAHGGTLGVTSQPGHGSVFTLTLPIA